MKILRLKLQNFRGIKNLELQLDGHNAKIFGANGTGKTTIANAVCWLIAGIPATGEKGFDPKTAGSHNLHHIASITMELAGGEIITFEKDFYEVWKRKKGSESPEFSGNTTDYRINGVKDPEKIYNTRIEAACGCSADKIRMLMILGYFSEELSSDDRRKILFDVCGDVTDGEVILENKLSDLTRYLQIPGTNGQYYTTEQYKKIAKERKLNLNKDLERLPERIDELTRSIPETIEDEEALQKEIDALNQRKNDMQKDAASMKPNDAHEEALRAAIAGMHTAMEKKRAAYVVWIRTTALAATAGTKLAGGSNGETVTGLQYQAYIDAIEPYYFNCMGYVGTDETIQSLLIAFNKRLRDSVGAKFQLILYGKEGADYEGVISIKNAVTDVGESPASAVYWLTGAEASCNINASCTNKTYDGEFTINTKYSQSELEKAITDGMLMFHNVADSVSGDIVGKTNVLDDINTFTSFTKQKNDDFSLNQVIRVLDQDAIDISRLFNKTYLGKEQNDQDGRVALWGDIVALHKEYQKVRAIQNFKADDVPIPTQGEKKTTVMSDYAIQPTCCMEKLYIKCIVA